MFKFDIGDWFDEHIVDPMNDFVRKQPEGLWWFTVIAPIISIIISLIGWLICRP